MRNVDSDMLYQIMEKDQVSKCYHCGNHTTLKLIQETEVEESTYDLYNEYQTFVFNYYYVFKCVTCERSSVYGHFYTDPEGNVVSIPVLVHFKSRIHFHYCNSYQC